MNITAWSTGKSHLPHWTLPAPAHHPPALCEFAWPDMAVWKVALIWQVGLWASPFS